MNFIACASHVLQAAPYRALSVRAAFSLPAPTSKPDAAITGRSRLYPMENTMKKLLIICSAILALSPVCTTSLFAASQTPYVADGYTSYNDSLLSMEELEDLVAPIALYPDPLIAQILPAATFVDQIDEAARYIAEYGRYARIDSQYWDVSVKAIAHYPDLLKMMDSKYEWTVTLGQAFIDQRDDLMYAIQLLRQDAREAGNLISTPQQQVVVENGYISILPTAPEVIYIPSYDPAVVYVEQPSPGFGFIHFSIGFTIGAWLNRDCDWRGGKVYYHGWRGRPWVDRARPHIQVNNTVYVNNIQKTISINRKVMQHDNERYRQQIRQDVISRHDDRRPNSQKRGDMGRPDTRRSPNTHPAPANQPRTPDISQRHDQRPSEGDKRWQPGKPAGTQTSQPHTTPPVPGQAGPSKGEPRVIRRDQAPAAAPQTNPALPPSRQSNSPNTRDIYRGRDTQNTFPASRSGYGGYGSGRDASIYRERGKSSQEVTRPQQPLPAQQRRPSNVPPQMAPPRNQSAPQTVPAQRPQNGAKPPVLKDFSPKHTEQRPAPAQDRGDRDKRKQGDGQPR